MAGLRPQHRQAPIKVEQALSIEHLLVRETDPLGAALQVLDKNGFGLAFAVDADGRYCGTLGVAEIRGWLTGGGSLGSAVESALGRGNGGEASPPLGADADEAAITRRLNGKGTILPLVDRDRRPVDFASPARRRRIPVAEPCLGGNERKYVNQCLDTNWISSQGPFVRRFEEAFAQRLGVPHAVAVSSGTAALHLALLALGVGPGDEVIVPDLTFAATINTVLHCGARPVIVDVDRASWNIDPQAVAAAITPRTRALLPVHLYGQPAAMDELQALARRHDLLVIEDAAESIGASYRGCPTGSLGHAGAFSFFSNKLVTTGEGGMAVFQDSAAAEQARILRDHGMRPERRYWHEEVGFNHRLTNLQAAIGLAQLERLDDFLDRKRALIGAYRAGLAGLEALTLPAEIPGLDNSYWSLSVIADLRPFGLDRDGFMARLDRANIETRPLFYPLHVMPPYRAYGSGDFPVTSWLSEHGVSLPSSVTLTLSEVDYVCGVIRRLLAVRRLVREARTG